MNDHGGSAELTSNLVVFPTLSCALSSRPYAKGDHHLGSFLDEGQDCRSPRAKVLGLDRRSESGQGHHFACHAIRLLTLPLGAPAPVHLGLAVDLPADVDRQERVRRSRSYHCPQEVFLDDSCPPSRRRRPSSVVVVDSPSRLVSSLPRITQVVSHVSLKPPFSYALSDRGLVNAIRDDIIFKLQRGRAGVDGCGCRARSEQGFGTLTRRGSTK